MDIFYLVSFFDSSESFITSTFYSTFSSSFFSSFSSSFSLFSNYFCFVLLNALNLPPIPASCLSLNTGVLIFNSASSIITLTGDSYSFRNHYFSGINIGKTECSWLFYKFSNYFNPKILLLDLNSRFEETLLLDINI